VGRLVFWKKPTLTATELWDEDRQFHAHNPHQWVVCVETNKNEGLSVLCELESPLKEGIREGENPVFGHAGAF
jgi:hypothetical protein